MEPHFKHFTRIVCQAVAIIVLSACGRQEEFIIGFSQCSDDAWRNLANEMLIQEASFHPELTIKIKTSDHDSGRQIKDIEDFIKEGVDLLLISPDDPDSLRTTVEKAYGSGTPVVLYDRLVNSDKYTAFVGGDNYQIGQKAAEHLYDVLDGKGDVALIRGKYGASADMERCQGFRDKVKELGDGITIKDEAEVDYNIEDQNVFHVFSALFEQYGTTSPYDAVFAMSDNIAIAVSATYDQHSIKKPVIIGVDAIPTDDEKGVLAFIGRGDISASLIYPTGATKVIEVVSKILTGRDFDKMNLLSTALVTKQNSEMYKMQYEKIMEREQVSKDLNRRNKEIALISAKQKVALIMTLGFILFLILVLTLLVKMFIQKNSLVASLNRKNEEIEQHLNSLEEQKRQLVSMSEQLEENTNAKLVFFTNISHDFKTPLFLINGPVQELARRNDLPKDVRPVIDIIKRNTNKLGRLIDELLDFRTVENGKMKKELIQGQLDQFIGEIAKMFKDAMDKRHIEFSYIVEDGDHSMLFDPSLIEKIFTNLLSNAFKHCNPYGKIRVRLGSEESRTGQNTVLSVFNSGSYIEPEQADNIFKRFYTLDRNQKGTGIGLALVSSIVDALGGSISVESDPVSGTEFRVRLPIIVSDEGGPSFTPEVYTPAFTNQKLQTIDDNDERTDIVDEMKNDGKNTILVIDDNNDIRQFIKTSLASDYRIITARNGEEGLAKAETLLPDLILCDIIMPDKDGFEVCSILKKHEATRNIPLILLTASSLDEQRAKGYESGADSYLEKPFDMVTLKVRIKQMMEKGHDIKSQLRGDWLIGNDISAVPEVQRDLLNSIKEYVDQHMTDNITIDDLATHIGYSKSKLYKELKAVTESSPIDLVNMVRLHKALELMMTENMNISQASICTGFSSPSYFSRTFMKFYHTSPSEYLKNH